LISSSGNSDQERKSIFSPNWIDESNWTESEMVSSLEFTKIQSAPAYDSAGTIKREYEAELDKHYDAKPYWE